MKKSLFEEIEIPQGVEVMLDEGKVIVKGEQGENKRTFNTNKLVFKKEENKIIIGNKKCTKTEKKMMKTIVAHIKNMIKGVQKKFEYQLKICFSHFPITLDIKENDATIKNFLGEKIDRHCTIPEGVEIEMKKQDITIKSVSKELAGQAAANFEIATKIRNKDKRIFQDGIYIVNKNGKVM